jgi:hypothetical protein
MLNVRSSLYNEPHGSGGNRRWRFRLKSQFNLKYLFPATTRFLQGLMWTSVDIASPFKGSRHSPDAVAPLVWMQFQ